MNPNKTARTPNTPYIALVVVFLIVLSCDEGDIAENSPTDSGTARVSEIDTTSDLDSDSAKAPEQPEIMIIVQNNTGAPRYFQTEYGKEHIVGGMNGQNKAVELFEPACSAIARCDEITAEDKCNIECDMSLGVVKLAAGESFKIPWDGKLTNWSLNYCTDGGACFHRTLAPVGEYKVQVTSWPDYQCPLSYECEVFGEFNLVVDAKTTGQSTVFEKSFSVVTTNDVVISIAD